MILVKWRNKLITVILLLFIFLELFSIYKITTMATFELKQTVFTYELGQEVSQNIDNYVIVTGGKETDQICGTSHKEMYYTAFLNHFLSLIDDEEEREKAREQFSLQNLINRYKEGQKDVSLILSSLNCFWGKKCRALHQLVLFYFHR